VILDVSNRHKTPAPSNNRNSNIVNFADAFQKEDLNIKNLAFEEENRNNKIKNKNRAIKDKKQTKLQKTIPDNLPFTIVIPQRQRSKGVNNNTRRYNLRKSIKRTR